MNTVWMQHPQLPRDQLIEVPESSVPHHRAAGWQVVDAPPVEPRLPAAPQPSEGSESSAPPTPPKRRRAPKESE